MEERSHLRTIFGSMGKLLGGKAVAAIVSLIYIAIVTRALGPSDFGVLTLVNTYVTMVGGVIAFSGWHAIVRYGTAALAKDDGARFMRLTRFSILIEASCAIVAILVAALLAPMVGRQLGWSPEVIDIARIYSVALLANVSTTPHGILQIANRFDLLGLHPALAPLLRLAGCLGVWLAGWGLEGFLIVWLVTSVAEGVFMWAMGLYVLRTLGPREPLAGPVRGVTRENERILWFMATTNADLTLRDLTPKLVPLTVGWMLGPAAAGLYSLAIRASAILAQPAVLLSQAGYPVVARMIIEGREKDSERLTWRTAAIMLGASLPIIAIITIFAADILELIGGKGFEAGAGLFVLMAIGRAALLGAVPFSSALIALGRPSLTIAVNLATNLGLYPLLPVAILWLGLVGAGWHALVQGVATTIVLALLYRSRARRIEKRGQAD